MEITATIIVKMNEPIDQPLMDWLIDAIQEQLEDGEELLSYVDTQAGDAFPVNDKTPKIVGNGAIKSMEIGRHDAWKMECAYTNEHTCYFQFNSNEQEWSCITPDSDEMKE